jgi:hypothetical protein
VSRLQFILVGVENNIVYYRTQIARRDEPEMNTLWADLQAVSEQQVLPVKALLLSLEHREATGEVQS